MSPRSLPQRVRRNTARPELAELDPRVTPAFFGNQLFPSDSPWNQVIANAPVSADSAAIIGRLVARGNARLHPDFGNPVTDGALYGIPVTVVDSSVPKVPVLVPFPPDGYGNESDHVDVPIPANAVIEGDTPTGPASPVGRGDSHLIVYDKSANVVYETYLTARPTETTFPSYDDTVPGPAHTTGRWGAYSLSVWDLNQNTFRTIGWTSADAAGLPILPGLVRPDEALPADQGGQGAITHAIRVTVQQTRTDFVYPASHQAGNSASSDLPRMGERFRLKSDFVIPANWSPATKAIAQAMKDYGLIVADNGSDMYFQGTPSSLWDMSSILQLQQSVRAGNFEVVDLTPVVTGLSAATGNPAGGYTVSVFGKNFSGSAGTLQVSFGGTAAPAITIVSDSRVDVTVPAHTVGTVDVRVRSGSNKVDADGQPVFFGYGTSAVAAADQFTFADGAPTPPPVLPTGSPPTVPPVGGSPPTVPPAGSPPTVPPVGGLPTVPPTGGLPTSPLPPSGGNPPDGTPPAGGPNPNRAGVPQFAVGPDAGGSELVTVYNPDGSAAYTVTPLPGLAGGVRPVAVDLNGDGVADLAAGTGPGVGNQVAVFDGKTQQPLASFQPFEASFTGGVFLAAGDVNGDGVPDLVVTPDQTGGSVVAVFDGASLASGTVLVLGRFLGIDDRNFRGGARAAVGDVNGDGVGDVIVSAGFGGGPRIAVFDGRSVTGGSPSRLFADFFAFEPGLRNGAYVAVGDVSGDGRADLVFGAGPGGAPRVRVVDAGSLLAGDGPAPGVGTADFFAGDPAGRGGVRAAVKNLGDGLGAELVVGSGAGAGSRVTVYTTASILSAPTAPTPTLDFDAVGGSADGVFVG